MNKIASAVVTLAALAATSAQAALDPAITTAVTDAGTDGKLLAGMVLVVLIGIAAFKWLRSAGK